MLTYVDETTEPRIVEVDIPFENILTIFHLKGG